MKSATREKGKRPIRWIAAGFLLVAILIIAIFICRPSNSNSQGRKIAVQFQTLKSGEFAETKFWVHDSWSFPRGWIHGDIYGIKIGHFLLRMDVKYDPVAAIKKSLPKTVSGLLGRMDTKDGLVLQCVIESLTELGPEAEPAISALLLRYQNGDEFAGGEITEIAKAIGPSAIPILSAALTNNSTIIVAKAIECLGEIGTNACAAIPNLSSVLTNSFSTNALAAAYALRKITHANHGEVQTLLSLLDDENSQVRAGAIVVLGEFGTDASQAAEPLLRFLDPARPDIAGWTARTLGMIGPASRIAIPQLISLLNDRNPTNMIFVMEALGVFGENAKSAIPMLCAIADDPPEHQFGFIAIKTLGEIGADALPCLLSLYQKAKPDYSSLSKAITTMGSNAAPAVQVLIQELAADRPYPSAWAAMALGSIGASAKLAVPHLTELLRSANPHLRLRAAEALWRIDYQTNAVLAVMVSELTEWSRSPNALIGVESDSNNESRQQVAARVLGEIGPAAQDAIPLLQMLQRSSFAEQRTAAIEALRKISPGNY